MTKQIIFDTIHGSHLYGRFNPTLDDNQIKHVNNIANAYSGDDLRGYLLG